MVKSVEVLMMLCLVFSISYVVLLSQIKSVGDDEFFFGINCLTIL